jgi:hypothetical protein
MHITNVTRSKCAVLAKAPYGDWLVGLVNVLEMKHVHNAEQKLSEKG